MTEYWLISAPGDKTCQQTWETMNNTTSKQNTLSTNYKFHIPDLKVGTLDQLVGLSDDLGKLDGFVEQVTRKVAAYLGEVLEDQRDKLQENLMANNNRHYQKALKRRKRLRRDTWLKLVGCACDKLLVMGSRGRPPDDPGGGSSEEEEPHTSTDSPSSSVEEHTYFHFREHTHHRGEELKYSHGEECNHSNCQERKHSHCQERKHSHCQELKHSHDNERKHSHEKAWKHEKDRKHSHEKDRKHSHEKECKHSNDEECKHSHDGERSHSNDEERTPSHADERTSSSSEYLTPLPSPDSSSIPDDDCCHCNLPLGQGDLPSYITRFQWDIAKYPIKQSLRNIADIISKQVGQIDADLKTKSTAYNNLKGSLQNLEKKQTGSLLTRNLADLVKKDHFILDSEYLSTLLVIVPKPSFNDWQTTYEKLTDMIVPRSSQLITQDAEYGLFTVSLFKKVVEEFKLHAREKKFIVREFTYNEEELAAGKNEITRLVTDKKKQFGPLVRWLKVNFSECFCAWIHVKALRVFVESVLRYGLPVNFQAILLHPNKKTMKRLRDVLNQLYGHLDSSALSGSGNIDSVDIPGLGFGQSEYYPYVYYKINVDMIDTKV